MSDNNECKCMCHDMGSECMPCCKDSSAQDYAFQQKPIDYGFFAELYKYITHQLKVIDKRISGIESAFEEYSDIEKANDFIFQGSQTHASILKCESEIKKLSEKNNNISEVISNHQRKIMSLQSGQFSLANDFIKLDKRIDELGGKLNKIESYFTNLGLATDLLKFGERIEKIESLVQMEDRITVCDVLNRITLLEGFINGQIENDHKTLGNHVGNLRDACARIEKIEDFLVKNSGQYYWESKSTGNNPDYIMENIHERIKKLENSEDDFRSILLMEAGKRKYPHKCVICDGTGRYTAENCHSCEGKGIIWG